MRQRTGDFGDVPSDLAEPTTFSATDVVAALQIPRTSFDAWVLRGHLDLPKGPGTGRARRLTFLEVVRTAALAELVRSHIPPKAAADLLRSIDKDFKPL